MTKITDITTEQIINQELKIMEFFLVLVDEYGEKYHIPINASTYYNIDEKDDSIKPTIWKLFKDVTRTVVDYTINLEQNGEYYGILKVNGMELNMRVSDVYMAYWPYIKIFINVDDNKETKDIDKLIEEAFKNDNFDEALRLKKIKENNAS